MMSESHIKKNMRAWCCYFEWRALPSPSTSLSRFERYITGLLTRRISVEFYKFIYTPVYRFFFPCASFGAPLSHLVFRLGFLYFCLLSFDLCWSTINQNYPGGITLVALSYEQNVYCRLIADVVALCVFCRICIYERVSVSSYVCLNDGWIIRLPRYYFSVLPPTFQEETLKCSGYQNVTFHSFESYWMMSLSHIGLRIRTLRATNLRTAADAEIRGRKTPTNQDERSTATSAFGPRLSPFHGNNNICVPKSLEQSERVHHKWIDKYITFSVQRTVRRIESFFTSISVGKSVSFLAPHHKTYNNQHYDITVSIYFAYSALLGIIW